MRRPSPSAMVTMSPSSNSPSMAVTPTSSRLTARSPRSTLAALSLICTRPLAKLALWASHFFMFDAGSALGVNSVCRVPSGCDSRSVSMLSRLPLAMITLMPSSATFLAMWHLVSIPPRPKPLFSCRMYVLRSLPGSTRLITRAPGAPGSPS